MICPKCQAKNPEENSRCFNCGADLSEKDPFGGMKTILETDNIESQFKKGTLFAGRYEILEDGLKGGMGMVFKVKDNTLGKIKALKLILPQYLENESAISRFKQEVAITQEFNHENIVRVHDIGESEGVLFFSMEWIDGISFRDFINERKKHGNYLSLDEIIHLMRQMCSALSYAHKSIIHRDIKPENILIIDANTKNPKIKITDFGIAKADSPALHKSLSSYMGTPIYMAPEQYTDAAHVDKRADIYSLGVILYEIITFLPPLGAFPPPSEVNLSIPKKIDDIINKAMALDKSKRYAEVSEIIRELETSTPETGRPEKGNTRPPLDPPVKKSKLKPVLVLAGASLLAIIIIIIIGYSSIFKKKENSPVLLNPPLMAKPQEEKSQIQSNNPIEHPSPSSKASNETEPIKKREQVSAEKPAEVPNKEKKLSEFKALINQNIAAQPGKTNVAMVIEARKTQSGYFPESALQNLLGVDKVKVVHLFQEKPFREKGFFNEIYNGNTDILKKANALSKVNYLILGKLNYSFKKGGIDNDLTSCSINFSYKIINKNGDIMNSDNINLIGPGFSEDAALGRGIELISEKYSERILRSIL